MLRMGVRPKLVRQGNHLLEMSTSKRGTITRTVFRDSYKLIPIKLASFVKTFGLSIEGVENKKYFPHGFNKAENYGNVLDNLPPIESYNPGSMLPDDKKALESWYEENRENRFDLREVIADYCKTDVQILAHGLIKMRELFTQKTGADITDSITIPSACMRFFVTLAHMGNERIAIVPHLGYEKRGKQSTIARKYLKWRAEEEERENGYTLRHVESPGGEYKFGNYSLDGMIERADADKNLAIEVNGCYWHACPHCFPEDDAIVGGGETAGAIRARDEKRTRAIAREFEVEIVWECQLHRMLEDDPAMKAFFDNTPDSGPIEFHDAFFGGRTGPEWLGASVVDNPERTIKIKDFNSLYPSRNMYTKYPVGHPVSLNFNKDVNWRKPSDIVGDDGEPLEGIIKCFVVPPRHCLFDIPVLPLRMNNRTLFPLCRKCSEIYPNGLVDPEYNCPHFEDHERGFSTTVCHIELEPALRAGYRVTRLYWANVWKYCGDWSDSLFHRYLEKFLKIKFEANGYPADCLDESVSEEERQRRKEEFVEKTWTGDKVRLDPANIKPNPGLRYLAKLCLNSLWGRFALRNRLTVTEIVDNNCDLSNLLNNEKIDISSLDQLTDKFWMVCFKTKDEHVVEHDTSNVVIALWTTAAARIHLLESLQKVFKPEPGVDRFDTRNLYMDTDSIFSDFKTAIGDPLPSGKHLGELTDEYPNEKIMEYVCAGPKAYGIWYKDKDGVDKYKLKLRGITLDSNACQRMNFDRMKEMVIKNWGTPDNNVRFDYPTRNFRITNKGDIFTVPLTKQFNPTVNKGVIRDNGLKIVPFGYSSYEYCKPRNPYDCIYPLPHLPRIGIGDIVWLKSRCAAHRIVYRRQKLGQDIHPRRCVIGRAIFVQPSLQRTNGSLCDGCLLLSYFFMPFSAKNSFMGLATNSSPRSVYSVSGSFGIWPNTSSNALLNVGRLLTLYGRAKHPPRQHIHRQQQVPIAAVLSRKGLEALELLPLWLKERLGGVPLQKVIKFDVQADLADFQALSRKNSGYRYLLLAVDVLSRRMFGLPVKSKKPADVKRAFEEVFGQMPKLPETLYTDRGLEFVAKPMKEFFAEKGIKKYERRRQPSQREPFFLSAINNSVCRATGLKPNDITDANAREVWKRVYGEGLVPAEKRPKIKAGETVRIPEPKHIFEKGYIPNYSDHVYTVDEARSTNPSTTCSRTIMAQS
ncbi:hypothetical protein niasHS_001758 [Heterodera schachtii]|uniref:DNA-directed DNA polymerase n=1 Tax=Heterodera schachtii TaxID=97005 RepID=A0ABD2K8E6_HETSC